MGVNEGGSTESAASQADDPLGIIEPRAPLDDCTFEQLASAYAYDRTSDRRRVFVRLLVKEFNKGNRPVRVLDIGCGGGISAGTDRVTYLRAIRAHADELWGLEPDESVTPIEGIFDHFQHALMETADLPENSFDAAYSFMVMEHVADPEPFLRAVHRCLKPGGRYLFVTPNLRHGLIRAAKTLHTLKLDEIVLRILHGAKTDEYHYPVQYKLNREADIDEHARRVGFAPAEVAYCETSGMQAYFRGPLKAWRAVIEYRRRRGDDPRRLMNLFGRLTKPR